MKKSIIVCSLILFGSFMLASPSASYAACNEGHQAYGKQSWGSNWSLVCDGSTTASCCTSKPVSEA